MKSYKLPESPEKQNLIAFLKEEEKMCMQRAKECKPDVCFDVSVEEEVNLAKAEVYRYLLHEIL